MADAALGGKTGFDLFGIKNLAGTFLPARQIYMPLDSLATLDGREWKSGMAEIIKTAILAGEDFFNLLLCLVDTRQNTAQDDFFKTLLERKPDQVIDAISRSVRVKGRIVEADPRETGQERALLNLGHTFGHALEAAAGLGRLSHGEAVAWGLVRACELGRALGITPPERAARITGLVGAYGYEIRSPHPLMGDPRIFMQALEGDKKKKAGQQVFVVPAVAGAQLVSAGAIEPGLLDRIVNGTWNV
jgi:3-dehydroquinate synthase